MNSITEFFKKIFVNWNALIKARGLTLELLFFYIFAILWLGIYGVCDLSKLRNFANYYHLASRASLEELRAWHATDDENQSTDYYAILHFCDTHIPKGERVKLILPTTQTKRFLFLRDKGRYFLYPRNWGDNTIETNYILVYDVRNFIQPPNFHIRTRFGPGKYLLERIVGAP